VDEAIRDLEQLLARFQAAGELRPDFDARVMKVAIRAAIDAMPPWLTLDPAVQRQALIWATRHQDAKKRLTRTPRTSARFG
jgi:hypothetical protein